MEARGTGFLDKDLNIYDAATSYLLGLTGAYSIKWRQSKLYFGECFTILRTLGLHKSSEPSTPFDSTSRNPKHDLRDMAVDRILEEMGRRTFWLLFVSAKSMHQLGASFTDFFIPPATPRSQYPPLPSEVDDVCIFSDRILQQPLGVVSLITGFNANVRVFLSYDALSTMDMTYGTDESVDWDKQKLLVQRCLAACRTALEGVPRELKLRQDNTSFSTAADGLSRYQQLQADDDILGKRQTQFEIQKANIYVSQLGTRSYILEKYWTLCERNRAQKAGMSHTQSEQDMEVEREAIVRELLFVLNSISIVNMEPNGGNQVIKLSWN